MSTLRPKDIVIIDNLGSHRGSAVRNAILISGARIAFLPPYSPDLDPIEQVLAKIKHWMRMAHARCHDAIHDRIAPLVGNVPARACQHYQAEQSHILRIPGQIT